MKDIIYIDSTYIEANTNFDELIQELLQGFLTNEIMVPMRHHHDFPNPIVNTESTLLLMPAWTPSKDAGIKIVTVNPKNNQFDLPSIQGIYVYLNAINGTVKALLDAKQLTVKRTAAASALASSYLSRVDSKSMLMIGSGALSINLIKAHAAVRPLKHIYVWGRNFEKAKTIATNLAQEPFSIKPIRSYEEVISEVDIISCATLSKTPLVFGKYLKKGQHIDLVGSYKKDMREADDEVLRKATVFLDSFEGGLIESGDIVIPLQTGVIRQENIKADLFDLTSNRNSGRSNADEITVFKSVGHALEDLVAANYYYNKYINE